MNLLLAFDAVMRHGAVTAAADELGLTQSTVSRLVMSLEAQLGQPLFTRNRKRLVPTMAAIAYQREVARALGIVLHASMKVVANPEGGALSLAVLPTFATRWLGPRLSDFLEGHPGISFNMSTRFGRFDFDADVFDAAISFGDKSWPATEAMKLFDEKITACVSPKIARDYCLETPEDLLKLPMLSLQSRPTAWEDWFIGQGSAPLKTSGMMMDQFSMMIQAAISGLGVALLPDYLAEVEIAEGRLVPFLKPAVPMRGAYWLLWPENKSDYLPLIAFREWIARETKN